MSKKDYKNQLSIQLHEDGLLHCYARMILTELPPDAVYPVRLPKRSHFTSLLIKEYHQKLFHSGVSHTLAQGRAEVEKAIHDCGICKRFPGGPSNFHQCLHGPGRK